MSADTSWPPLVPSEVDPPEDYYQPEPCGDVIDAGEDGSFSCELREGHRSAHQSGETVWTDGLHWGGEGRDDG